MNRRKFIGNIGKAAAGLTGVMAMGDFMNTIAAQDKKWNFLFILADDMGWNQVGYIGSEFYETPNIDRIAREGIYFTDAYTPAPVCSPARAGILTGKYPARLHITDYLPGDPFPWAKLKTPVQAKALPLEEVTLAEMLKEKGYSTAMIGKWHVSTDKNYKPGRPFDPGSQGFDYVHTTVKPEYSANPNEDAHHAMELTEHALKFLDNNKDNPFLLYVSHHVVHRPIMEAPELVYKYKQKPNADLPTTNPMMGAMIETMDKGIGMIMDKLDELNLTDNTVVVFYSDNGGLDKLQSQAPLRGGKAMVYEGGIRVPLAIKWPGVVKPGSKSVEPVSGCDLFPTFAEIAGLSSCAKNVDGRSLVPLLSQKGEMEEQALYWHFPHYHRQGYLPSGAMREGNYKLLEWYEKSKLGEDGAYSLYNIKDDIGEQNDLAKEMPKKVEEMAKKLHDWRKRIGAKEMTPNPDYDPAKALFYKKEVDPNSAEALGQYY
ncbi:sulfatase [Bacteroidota bacterium]